MVEFNLKDDLLNRSEAFRVQLDNYLRQVIKKYNSSEKYIDTLESQELLTKFKEIASSNKRFKQNELYGLNKGNKFVFSDLLVESLALEQINQKNKGDNKLINFHSTQVVLVVMEDSGYGFLFMKYILRKMYPDYRVIMIQTMGNQNLENVIPFIKSLVNKLNIKKIEVQILLYDAMNIKADETVSIEVDEIDINQPCLQLDRIQLSKFLRQIQKSANEIQPICFEELMIQVSGLKDLLKELDLYNDRLFRSYYNLLNGLQSSVQIDNIFFNMKTAYNQYENCFEEYVSNLLRKTGYDVSHKNSTLGWCWYKKCKQCNKQKYCENYDKAKKLDIYIHKQILYVIIRQIDIELGLQYRADEDLDVKVMNKDNYLSSIITLI